LRDALEPDASIVVVQGMGGAGKTWLALDVANDVHGTHLFANVVWTTARDAPLTFDAWLRRIARVLSRADLGTLSPEHLRPSVARLLGDRAVLLVVDNFESIDVAEQDKMLNFARWIRPPSRILLTSRHVDFVDRMPSGSVAPRVIPIGGLSSTEAQQLFFAEVDRLDAYTLRLVSDAEFAAVYDVTSGHPLGLCLLVAAASKRTLEVVLRDLRAASQGALDALFDQSWERLSPCARSTLQAASVLDGPVSCGALAAMTGHSSGEVDGAVVELQGASMLEPRGRQFEGDVLVGLHPLTRAFVRAHMQESAGLADQLLDRAAAYYLKLVGENGGFLDELGHERIERELATILAVRDWCRERNRLLWLLQFSTWLGNFLWVRGYWRERIRSGVYARQAASGLGLKWEEGEILSRELGWSHLQLDELDEARSYLDQAKLLLTEVQHGDELASCWRYLGQIGLRKGDLSTCRELLRLALDAASRLPNHHDRAYAVARTRVDLGYLALKQHDVVRAESEFQEAVDFFRRVGDEIRLAYGLNGLGDAALEKGQPEKASHFYNQSLAIADRFGSAPDRARALIRRARLHRDAGNRVDAANDETEALAIAQRLGLPAEASEAERVLRASCPLRVDVAAHLVWVCDVEVHLEPLAVELLLRHADYEG
jgi:tetratricopeptide (TPR) repeat protein